MKRLFAAACVVLALGAVACGGGDRAGDDDPTGLVNDPQSNFLQPPAKARDTVNELNDKLNGLDQQTGPGYTP